MTTKPFFIKVITPLHAGSGSDLGVVDMPIQRESHTSFPKIEASSLKGSIRSEFVSNNDEDKAKEIFGIGDKAGDLGFSDARILFFPVKSVKGVFAYVTCPMVLNRLQDDLKLENKNFTIPKITLRDEQCIVFSEKNSIDKNVILEEYSFAIDDKQKPDIKFPYFDKVKERLVIISDDNFTHFVKNSTEVITRIKIDNDKGTVQQGGLFTEEYLPSESVMYALALGEVAKFTNDDIKIMQIGGDTNLGKGIVELTIGVKVGDEK